MSTHTSQVGNLVVGFKKHPYQALLVVAGVGYILGGGLFTRLTFNMLRVGVRLGALPLVRRELLGFAESALSEQSSVSS